MVSWSGTPAISQDRTCNRCSCAVTSSHCVVACIIRQAARPAAAPRVRIGMSQRLLTVAAWSCFVFIVYATLSSQSARPELTSTEPPLIVFIERFGAYAVLGCLFRLAHPRRVVLVVLVVFGGAVLLELLQNFVPDRDARISDALVKSAGGFVGVVLADAIRDEG